MYSKIINSYFRKIANPAPPDTNDYGLVMVNLYYKTERSDGSLVTDYACNFAFLEKDFFLLLK